MVASAAATTACDRAPGFIPTAGEDADTAATSGIYRPTEVIGDTQIACNVALEAVYAEALTSARVEAVVAEIQATPGGANHRCRIAFGTADGDGPAVFEVTVSQDETRTFAVSDLTELGTAER